ncbi:MAG: outer membrane protein transport protein [Pseudomonadota bacterium]|nr:outer membrane protein transport protein [Pseudomonadota bacterium]
MKTAALFAGSTLAALLLAGSATASSFYLQDQSVKGLGRAYSGEVADQGAASLWWNPAAIARSGGEIYLGEHSILTSATVLDQGSGITRPVPPAGLTTPTAGEGRVYNPVEVGVVPNGAIAIPVGDRFALGLSVAAPYDFTSTYSSGSFARYNSLKSRLTTIDFQLTGAMKVTDWLDLGVALNSEYTSANLGNALPNLSPLLPDGQQVLHGDGWNYGYTVGAQVHHGPWELGASYKSKMDHDLDGTATVSGLLAPLAANNFSTNATAKFTTPWIATFGLRYHLTPQLTLNGQVERFGWSEFDAIRYTIAGATTATPENYKDTTSGAIGVDYAVNPAWTLRAGVGYDQSPLNPVNRDTRVPDSDRVLYTAGTSVKVRPNMTIDAAFGYVQFNGSTVNTSAVFYGGTPAATLVNERADIGGNAKILSLGMRYNF